MIVSFAWNTVACCSLWFAGLQASTYTLVFLGRCFGVRVVVWLAVILDRCIVGAHGTCISAFQDTIEDNSPEEPVLS